MKPSTRENAEVALIANKRPLTIAEHQAFREALNQPVAEDDFDDLIEVDPHDFNPPSRRSDRELNRMLSILDSIENGRRNH